jgi:hypothetical protein
MKCPDGNHISVKVVDSTQSVFVEKCLICGIELSRGEFTPWAHLIEPRGVLEVDWAKGDSQIVTVIEGSDGQGR